MELQDWYKEAGISEKVYDFCSEIEAGLKERLCQCIRDGISPGQTTAYLWNPCSYCGTFC